MRGLFWVVFAVVLICLCCGYSRGEGELTIEAWMRQYEQENNLPPANAMPVYEEEVVAVYEDLTLFDEYPEYVQRMSPEKFKVWATLQNEMAYFAAARRASERSFGRTVYNTTMNTLRNFGWFRGSSVSTVTTETWTPTQWGGGPVIIINPYVPPKQ